MRKVFNVKLFCVVLMLAAAASGQQKQESNQTPDQSDVIRVNTELVQTNVVVFDKQGRFVDGLQREQFELRVDGKPQPFSFFERVTAGTAREEALMTAARTGTTAPTVAPAATETRGRVIIFFIDDLHLSAQSVDRTRKAIQQFIDTEMSPEDQVAIASPSGQVGFLQQFTDNKSVLRAAVSRISHRPYVVADGENIPMSEYTALKVDQGDRDALDYYTTQLLQAGAARNGSGGGLGPPGGGPVASSAGTSESSRTSGMTKEMAERIIKTRAQVMLKQSASITMGTLSTLESLMRTSAQLPGRKLVFFVSDGFFMNDRDTGYGEKLHQITDAALRAGVVIYSMDARGLTGITDAGSNKSDPSGKLSRSNIGELSASQDPLTTLAEDTGGRALLNSSALNQAVSDALKETSNYYLLAWRPGTEEQKNARFKRVEVSIAGRPELVVRLPRGYLEADARAAVAREDARTTAGQTGKAQPESAKGAENDLRTALLATAPRKGLPTMLAVSFLDTPNNGPIITASVQASTAALNYGADGKQTAAVDLAGVVLSDQGKPVNSFKTRLTVSPLGANTSQSDSSGVIYNYRAPLTPGLYQVRVAARDDKSGLVGSAMQWIEIPDLSSRRLSLSTLLVGAQVLEGKKTATPTTNTATPATNDALPQVQFSVDRRFAHSASLSFWIFVYNAARGAGNNAPDLTAQVQVFRGSQAIVTTPQRKLMTEGMTDLARIPYGGQFPLNSLPAGRYTLQVTITDKAANTTATQRTAFKVE